MKKPFIAILIALLVTACVGASMFAIGGAALVNKNGSPASNSACADCFIGSNTSQPTDQVAQLQSLVSQYQDHEQQYQQREQQLQQQIAQANAQDSTGSANAAAGSNAARSFTATGLDTIHR